MPTPTTYNPLRQVQGKPPEVRRCYLCGKNTTLPRSADAFLLQVLRNGRSYNYCRKHWRKLREVASAENIEKHRRESLPEEDLKNNIHYKKLGQIIADLKRRNETK